MEALDRAFGKVLEGFALLSCALVGAITLMICADVLLRNVPLIPGVIGLAWSNELSETGLYLVTMLAAPWLLREGRHIRVDIVLRAIPAEAYATARIVDGARPAPGDHVHRGGDYTDVDDEGWTLARNHKDRAFGASGFRLALDEEPATGR